MTNIRVSRMYLKNTLYFKMPKTLMLKKIIDSIKEAENTGLLPNTDLSTLSGFSGNKLVGTLQRLVSKYQENPDACYLEVGVFQGLTLLSVATVCPTIICYGIDNFAYHDPNGENFSIFEKRAKRLGAVNATIINKDYEDALENLESYIGNKKIGVYFIDGPHDYRSQLMCLQLALPYLHDQAVIIVDDSNYRHVRQANRDFLITHPEYKLLFEAYTPCHPNNMSTDEEKEARAGWWNGVNIIVRDKDQELPQMFPETERSRILYENEHIIHASRLAELAPQSIGLLQYLYKGNFLGFIASYLKLFKLFKREKSKYDSRFPWTNTYSNNLTTSKFNSPNLQ